MHILFDLDGTLTDPRAGIIACIRFALSKLNIEIDPNTNLESFIGPPLRDTFLTLCESEAIAERAVSLYRERFAATGLYENLLYADIPDCLNRLRHKAKSLHVASSKPKIFCEKIIDHFDLSRYFDGVYGSEFDGSLSDKTELLGHIIKTESLAPQSTVMIGDRSFDMVGARNNGVRAIGVLWGFGTENELITAGADGLCQSPDELYDQIFC